jgi:hypothetical protein
LAFDATAGGNEVGTPFARQAQALQVTDLPMPPGMGPGEVYSDLTEFLTPYYGPASRTPVPSTKPARRLGVDLLADLAYIAGRVHLARATAAPDEPS